MMSRATSSVDAGRRVALALCAWLLLAPCAMAGSAIERLDVVAPRAFGWRIGDRLHRDIVLRLHTPYRLHIDKLPVAGRLTHWLALAAPRIEERSLGAITEYRIRLSYQLVNISPDVTDIALPEVLLRMGDGHEVQQALIPAARLGVGTITDFTQADLRPAEPPPPLALSLVRTGAAAAALCVALAGLAWLRWGGGFGRRALPFVVLRHQLAGRRDQPWQADDYAATLRAVHRAFNDTAGRTVFAETLDEFLAVHARFQSLATDIDDFFRHSNAHFFRPAGQATAPAYSRASLFDFVAACADLERGLG